MSCADCTDRAAPCDCGGDTSALLVAVLVLAAYVLAAYLDGAPQ